MSQAQADKESGTGMFADSLREIQGEYMVLGELYEKQRSYGQRLTETMKSMQFEVDTVIPIRPEALGRPCRAAYLVSEGVVVIFDPSGGMSTKPLYTFPSDVIVSIIQECTPELQRLLSEKRKVESTRVKSMERVLRELKKAQATFKQTKRDDGSIDEEEEEERAAPVEPQAKPQKQIPEARVMVEPPRVVLEPQRVVAEPEAPPARNSRETFVFSGRYGEKRDAGSV